jgi:putative hydrolase of the HAD superfamily
MTTPSAPRFRAVIFDLFGTLIPAFPGERFKRSLDEMAAAVGVDADTFTRLWINDTHLHRMTGRLASVAANVLHICHACDTEPGEQNVADAVRIRNEFTREVLQPRHDAVATLQSIRDAGLGTGLVSDCSAEVPQFWPMTPLAAMNDVPVFSCVAGTRKPDPRIFMMACDGLGVAPRECMYVGDGFSQELAGASALGMTAVLIAPPGENSSTEGGEAAEWKGLRIGALGEISLLLQL